MNSTAANSSEHAFGRAAIMSVCSSSGRSLGLIMGTFYLAQPAQPLQNRPIFPICVKYTLPRKGGVGLRMSYPPPYFRVMLQRIACINWKALASLGPAEIKEITAKTNRFLTSARPDCPKNHKSTQSVCLARE